MATTIQYESSMLLTCYYCHFEGSFEKVVKHSEQDHSSQILKVRRRDFNDQTHQTGSDEVYEVSGRRHNEKELGKPVGIDFGYELKRANDIAENYERWLKRLKSEKDDLEGKLNEKKEEVRRLEENLANMRSDADKSEEIKQKQEKRIAELNEEIVDLKDKIKFKDEEIENLKRTPVQPTKPPKSKKEKDLEKAVEEARKDLKMAKKEKERVHTDLDKQRGKLGQMDAAKRNKEYKQKHGK